MSRQVGPKLGLALTAALCAAGAMAFAGEGEDKKKGKLAFVHIDYVKPSMVGEYEDAGGCPSA